MMEFIKPVPLTEEWLLKFGFEKREDDASGIGVFTWWAKKGIEINEVNIRGERQWYLIAPYLPAKHFQYVHQLQNLYYSLTSEELNLKD